jgi:hypothetical protein
MKAKELANLNTSARELIKGYIEKKKLTLNAFSKKAGVHQSQLYLYLEAGKGLHSSTLEKIGNYIAENK